VIGRKSAKDARTERRSAGSTLKGISTPKSTESKSKAPARKPRIRRKTPTLGSEQIAERASYFSLESSADPLANWLQAERELVGV
jgi:hypothetical protein